ncbi:tape measure domain-containing protein [Motilibacter rhizosphaerae]|uniref:Tape measure domain-containing protein n=1 Tax=Motilibacter rhizosphaerae TaxID=598652 RepID=A0A4Q7NB83_9ACTN|nr:tape measure protein [Motilibacter rhizosphaerae]RZS80186.1 tape measure domain-containing protein [Motilibacter rhizosphaerae]
MADSSQTLRVVIVGDAKSVQRAFSGTSASAAKTEAALKRLSARTAAVGTAFGVMGGLAAASLARMAVNGAKAGFTLAEKLEQARIGFTTLLGSAKAADTMLNNLKNFAKTTPFEFPELVTQANRLLAMGFASKQIIPLLTNAGNAVAAVGGNGETLDRVTLALGQINTKGHVMAQEMNQLTEAGIPAWQMLADKLGTNVAGAMDKVTKRQVDSKTAMDAFMSGMEKSYGGMMDKQSHTVQGMISNIKDASGLAAANIVTAFFPAIKVVLNKFVDLTSWISNKTPAAINKVKGEFEKLKRSLKENLPSIDLSKLFKTGKADASAGKAFVQPILDSLGNAGSAVTEKVKTWRQPVMDAFSQIKMDVTPILHSMAVGIRDGAKTLIDAFTAGVQTGDWGPLGQAIGTAIGTTLKASADLATVLLGWVKQVDWVGVGIAAGKVALPFVIGLASGLLAFDPKALFSQLAAHWELVLVAGLSIAFAPAKIAGALGEVLARVPLAGGLLKWGVEALQKFGDGLESAAVRVLGNLGKGFARSFTKIGTDSAGSISGMIVSIVKYLAELPIRADKALLTLQFAGARAIVNFGRAMLDRAPTAVGDVLGTINRLLINGGVKIAKLLVDAGRNVIELFLNAMTGKFAGVSASIQALGALIKNAAADFGSLLVDAGVNLVRGLVRGVTSSASFVKDAMKGLASTAKNTFTSFLGIHSPSRVFAEYGDNTVEGYAAGVKRTTPKAVAAVAALARSVSDAMKRFETDLFNKDSNGIVANLVGDTSGIKDQALNLATSVLGLPADLGSERSGLNQKVTDASTANANAVKASTEAVLKRTEAMKKYQAAVKALQTAQEAPVRADKKGSTAKSEEAKAKAEAAAQKRVTAAWNSLHDAQERARNAAGKVTSSGKALSKAKDDLNAYDAATAKARDPKNIEAARQAIAVANQKLQDLAKQRDDVATKLKAAQDNLSSALGYASQVSGNLAGLGNLTGLLDGSTDADGNPTGDNTAAGLGKRLGDKLAQVKGFASNVKDLLSKGLNKQSLQDIVAAGADTGGQVAQALLNSPGSIGDINSMQSQIQGISDDLGKSLADSFYAVGGQTADQYAAGLQVQFDSLQTQMQTVADGLVTSLQTALGLDAEGDNPLKVLGEQAGAAFVDGFTDAVANGTATKTLTTKPKATASGKNFFDTALAGGITTIVNVAGSVISERDLAATITKHQATTARRSGRAA